MGETSLSVREGGAEFMVTLTSWANPALPAVKKIEHSLSGIILLVAVNMINLYPRLSARYI